MFRSYQLVLIPIVLLFAGCHNLLVDPTLAGRYRSTELILPGPADGPDDMAARGGFVELRLNLDGTTTGRQHLVFQDGQVSDLELNGVYAVNGDNITLDMAEPTWLEFSPLQRVNDELRSIKSSEPFRGEYKLVLKKVD